MDERPRDAGMVRVVGPWALAASIVGVIVGGGIFVVPAALAASVGSLAPLAFLGCGLAVGAVAICFAEGGSRIPTSGGVYGYIEAAFGSLAGYMAGTLLLVGDVLACGGIAVALADVAASLFPHALMAAVRVVVIVGAIGGIALVNIGGVARGARLVTVTTALKLVPLMIFVVAGLGAVHAANLIQAEPAAPGPGRAVILALFAFIGMETSLCASGEVKNPSRTIPRALGIAMLCVTLLYVAIQVVAQGIMGAALAQSTVPLADAMAQIHPALRALMLIAAAVSMFGWLGSDILGSPRQIFALARDGLLPNALGRLHPGSHAPHIAIWWYAAIAIALALTGTFQELAVLATLASAALYIAGCAGAWRLARRDIALAGEPLRFPHLGIATVIGISSMLALIALASSREILGLFGLLASSALAYVTQTRRVFA